MCTVNTTRGLFRVTRLQQGLKNAAAIFQQAIEEVLKGLDGCVAYQDDILLFGVTEAELRKRYNAVKERLAAKNFTVIKTSAYHSRQRYPFWAMKFHRKE